MWSFDGGYNGTTVQRYNTELEILGFTKREAKQALT